MSEKSASTSNPDRKRKLSGLNTAPDAKAICSQPSPDQEKALCAFCTVADLKLIVSYCRQCQMVMCAKCTEPHIDKQLVGHKVERFQSYLIGSQSEDTWYPVERIVGKKRRAGKVFYKVKWQNYPQEANSWEPADNISQDVISIYENMAKLAKRTKETKNANEKCC